MGPNWGDPSARQDGASTSAECRIISHKVATCQRTAPVTISVVIPAYNEAAVIGRLLDALNDTQTVRR